MYRSRFSALLLGVMTSFAFQAEIWAQPINSAHPVLTDGGMCGAIRQPEAPAVANGNPIFIAFYNAIAGENIDDDNQRALLDKAVEVALVPLDPITRWHLQAELAELKREYADFFGIPKRSTRKTYKSRKLWNFCEGRFKAVKESLRV